jgi:hypothetical protein
MKLLLENWRKFLAESNKKTGTLNSDYPGYVELYSPYSENKEQAQVGAPGDQAEILGSWSDKGVKWLEVDINGIKGWIGASELTMDEAVDKESMPCNKPRTTQTHKGKSHVVKACADGKEKVIPFGEKGASTAGKPKKGESEKMKKKRKSFKSRHAKNIKKGKMSAAYWADKVKW